MGAAGFIGTNLAIKLAEDREYRIVMVDTHETYFRTGILGFYNNIECITSSFDENTRYEEFFHRYNTEIVFNLVSTTFPGNSNRDITQEINANIGFASRLFEACVSSNIKKVIFISSGGAVYGVNSDCPLEEDLRLQPISSYGFQKMSIEKLLYVYKYAYGLDYAICRLSNPYGRYQRPNGQLGVVTTFVYKVINNEEITVYGDGNIVRDYIYIDDAVNAIKKIALCKTKYDIYNIGSGVGISVNEVIEEIRHVVRNDLKIIYKEGRKVDVPINFLNIKRYENEFGKMISVNLKNGIEMTKNFFLHEK